MRVIYPQRITEAADVLATNLVDTRYPEWDKNNSFNREDKVRVSAERSEYEAVTDHSNADATPVGFIAGWQGAFANIRQFSLDASGQVVANGSKTLVIQSPSSRFTSGHPVRGVAYDAVNDLLWIASSIGGLKITPHRIAGLRLVPITGAEITTGFTGSNVALPIDIKGTKLYAQGTISGVRKIKVYEITASGGTEISSEEINVSISTTSQSNLAVGASHAFLVTFVRLQPQIKAYSLATKAEIQSFRLLNPAGFIGPASVKGIATLARYDRLYIFGQNKAAALDIGDTALTEAPNYDFDMPLGTIRGAGLDLAFDLAPAIKNPVTEQAAFDDPVIPDPVPRNWARIGATMPWRMFDGRPRQRAERANSITATVKAKGVVDAVAVIGLVDVTQARVSVARPVQRGPDSVVFAPQALTIESSLGASLSGLVEADAVERNAFLLDFPAAVQADDKITLELTGGAKLGCGQLIIGKLLQIGTDVPINSNVRSLDYSRLQSDVLGNLVEDRQASLDVRSFQTGLDTTAEQRQFRQLAYLLRRGSPAVWMIGEGTDPSEYYTYGFYRNIQRRYLGPTASVVYIDVQSIS